MRTIYILLFLIFSFQALAKEQIRSKPIIQLALADNDDRLEHLEKANQQLLNRIEIAEHNIAKLEKVVNSAVQEEFTINNKPGAVRKVDNNANAPDIFGVMDEVVNKNPATSNKNVTTDKHLYDLALASLKDKNLSDSEEKFAEFLKKYPNSPLVSNAYFWYGDIFYQNKMFDKAAINYLKGYKQSPKGDKASDALLKSALSLGELKKNKEACLILSKLETEFPNRASASKKRAVDAEIKYGCNKKVKND